MERKEFDENIILTMEDYKNAEQTAPVLQNQTVKFSNLHSELFREASKSDDEKLSYILWMLADAAGIAFSRSSANVFEPAINFVENIRSAIPEDFSARDLNFFESIFPIIKHNMLKARIADILWYMKRKKIEYPEYVISVYLSLSYSQKDFYDNMGFIKRGLQIAKQLKRQTELYQFGLSAMKFLLAQPTCNTAYLLHLSDILLSFKLHNNESAEKVVDKLIACADELEANRNFYLSVQYAHSASLWSKIFDESNNKYIELQVKCARIHIHNAESSEHGFTLCAFYEKALQIIRLLPKDKRQVYFSQDEENALLRNIRSAGTQSIRQMKCISMPVDFGDCIKIVNENMSGKTKAEALYNLAYLSMNLTFDKTEESAITFLKQTPLASMFAMVHYSEDGRIVGRSSGIMPSDELNYRNQSVWLTMIRQYVWSIPFHVAGAILPALMVISNEHRITEYDMHGIVYNAPLVPPDRVAVFIKGLLAGFNYDFVAALHLLTPQVENLVRYHLRNANAKTSTTDKDGIETEIGLSNLVKLPEFEQIFGKDLGFEIKALLCEGTGPNLRNNVSHGLINIDSMQSEYSIYFWWLCYRMLYINFANHERMC